MTNDAFDLGYDAVPAMDKLAQEWKAMFERERRKVLELGGLLLDVTNDKRMDATLGYELLLKAGVITNG